MNPTALTLNELAQLIVHRLRHDAPNTDDSALTETLIELRESCLSCHPPRDPAWLSQYIEDNVWEEGHEEEGWIVEIERLEGEVEKLQSRVVELETKLNVEKTGPR